MSRALNSAWSTVVGRLKRNNEGMNESMNGRRKLPSDKDAGFVRYSVTLSVNLGGSYGDGRQKRRVSGRGSLGNP